MSKITIEDVKDFIKREIDFFDSDLEDKKYGEKAKLLKHHYERILSLLEHVKSV
jgi:hypothetical protein